MDNIMEKSEILHIKKKNLEAILLKIFRHEFWHWPALVKTKLGTIEKVEIRAGQILVYDKDPEDVLVCFDLTPDMVKSGAYLGSDAGGFEIEEEKE